MRVALVQPKMMSGSERRHCGARPSRKSTKSICRVRREPGIHNHDLGLWIPGLRQGAHPGMTWEFTLRRGQQFANLGHSRAMVAEQVVGNSALGGIFRQSK